MSTNVGTLSVELGISDAQLRAGLAQAVVQAQQAGQKMQTSLKQATAIPAQNNDAAKFRNQALLQASRGIQDFQAGGLMGIVNNVEGVAMSVARAMGKSTDAAAGLAGKMTLVAVAVQVGLPLVKSLADSVASSLGMVSTNAEKAAKSVKGMMGGGMGASAQAEGRKADADFLMGRTATANIDSESGFNALSRFFGMASTESQAAATNMRRATEATAAMSESMQMGAKAARDMRWLNRGSSAEMDVTTARKREESINKNLYQAAVDKYGGGDNLRTKIETESRKQGMTKTQARELYGGFAEGNAAATQKVESMLNLSAERQSVQSEGADLTSGQKGMVELNKALFQAAIDVAGGGVKLREQIENAAKTNGMNASEASQLYDKFKSGDAKATAKVESITDLSQQRAEVESKATADNMSKLADQFRESKKVRDGLEDRKSTAQERLDDLMAQRARSEVVGSSDVFNRNIDAGGENPTVKAIEKQTEEIKRLTDEIKGLG